ncbi:MAG: zinc metallopeptidase [Ruminococcus sp.]|jgi:Zn-dependent membrane protease YugP|nr:zinc metallopeptidase [Ruminococcus sp.]
MDILFLILIIVLPIAASINVKLTFKKYSDVQSSRGITAEQVARRILDSNGLYNVNIEPVSGKLTDHYDPRTNTVRLSDSVYGNSSIAAIGVAAHECGHVCQHSESYLPIVIRSKIVPVANICSMLWYWVFLAGVFFFNSFPQLAYAGIIMFGAVVVFQIVTLPTEFNASGRALKILENDGLLESSEIPAAKKVLNAAAMTYVVSLVASLLQLLRLILSVKRR